MQAQEKDDAHHGSNCSESTHPLSSSSDGHFETIATDASDSTGGTHSHLGGASAYTSLLGQVGHLHGDLSKTVALCQKLREENSALKESYERLRAQHLNLHDKFIATRKQAVEESTARIHLEQRHDELVQKWRKQLEKKAEEFRSLQASVQPSRDLEVLRGRVRRELELKHRETAEALEKQVNDYRKMYYEEKRAAELLKTEFEQFTLNRNSESEATKKQHEGHVAALKERVNKLEADLDNVAVQESERKVLLQLEEKKAEIDALEVEVQTVRKEYTAQSNKLQAENLQLKREVIEAKQNLRETTSEIGGLRSKLMLAEKAKTDLESQRDRLRNKVSSLDSHVERLEQQVDQAEQLCKKERLNNADKIAQTLEEVNADKHKLTNQMDTLQRALSRMEVDSSAKISEMTAEHKSRVALLTQELKQREQVITDLEQRSKEREQELQNSLKHVQSLHREERELRNQTQTQCEAFSSEIAQLEQAKTILQQKVQQLQDDIVEADSQKIATEDGLRELEQEYGSLREKYREAVVTQRELKSSQEFTESSLAYLEEEVQQLRKNETKLRANLDKVEERRVELLEASEEKENMLKTSLKAELQKGQASAQTLTQKFKKKHIAYRAALAKCKSRIAELKRRTAQLEQELASQTQLHQVESESAHRRIRELERERDLITRRQLASPFLKPATIDQIRAETAAQESHIETITKKVDELLEDE